MVPWYFTFKESYKAAGILQRANPGASSRTIAKRVHGTVPFGDKPMDPKTVEKAAKACSADAAVQYSPVKRGRVPLYPPDLANVLVQVLLEARKSGIRTGRTYAKYCAAVLLQGHQAEAHFIQPDGTILVPDKWFDSFVRAHKEDLDWKKPENRASSREEWEKIENMLPHYIKYEESVIAEGIGRANPDYDINSTNPDDFDLSHQRIIYHTSELYRVHSFDEVGWTLDMTDENNEKILCGKGETQPKVYSTKSGRRMTFVGGSKMDGTDLPQYGIFPCKYEKQWVAGAPTCRQVDPETKEPLPARYDASPSGGMTNAVMVKYFHSVIVPSTPGCENVTGKRHIQLTDSAGPHVFLDYLKLCNERGIIFIPRTPYLSHREQNEDLKIFGPFKIEQRKQKQAWQNQLLANSTAPGLKRTKASDRTLGFRHTMAVTAGPWVHAFREDNCRCGYRAGGYYPFTRLPMVVLMKEQMAAAAAVENAAKRRKINAGGVAGSVDLIEALRRINDIDPKWFALPKLDSVDAGTKIPAHVLAQMKLSPTSAEAIAIIDKKDKCKLEETAAMEIKKAARAVERANKELRGHALFQRVTDPVTPVVLSSLSVSELKELGAYKKEPATWKKADGTTIGKKVDMIAYLAAKHPLDFAPAPPPMHLPGTFAPGTAT